MMTRKNIEESIKEARRFIVTAQAAIERLDSEKEGRKEWYEYRAKRGIDEPHPPVENTPHDYSYGSPETGALRRHSMDLTRKLAELRRRA
jgi:hypothetical protein